MKNQLYMLAVLEDSSTSLPRWAVIAASQEYDRIAEQYKHTKEDRLILDWNIMKGVRIVRANLAGCQMSEDFTNIDMAFDNIAGHHRAGLYMPVFFTVVDFLK